MTTTTIVPSTLSADFANLGRDCQALEAAGADRLQWDVMDGTYVPNITFGPDVIAACRRMVGLPFEAHIMADRPEDLLERYVKQAGCEMIICHPETLGMPHRTYHQIKEWGSRVGIALSPATPLSHCEDVMDLVDMILIMTVNPGFGGQSYLSSMEQKVTRARLMIEASGRDIELEVDGGIGPDTIAGAAKAGANVFISGSALWRYDSFEEGIVDLRARADAARQDMD
ncbi:ribulose-phosphate 3-epimerase [Euzebya tangerina]|uniref:ribulose-phosphate 3-epimerase n=1 Tax=Euzebya tangerina TaxID=591198 RepID=UPI00196B67FA|nr:ribulose-phosphate 3-epimerase [Euzebya tangerina]